MSNVEPLRQATNEDEYGGTDDRPLRGYLAVAGTYLAVTATLALVLRKRRIPDLKFGDLALLTVATHKLSRVISKDAIASPLRAPFVRYVEPAGAGELNESVRVEGPTHAVGELLMCPLCLDVWVATGFIGSFALAPRATRLAASIFAAGAMSNVLHFAWDAIKRTAE